MLFPHNVQGLCNENEVSCEESSQTSMMYLREGYWQRPGRKL